MAELWLFGDHEVNHVEDVPAKFAALRRHRSQFTPGSPDDRILRDRMAEVAREAGLGGDRLAQRFRVLRYAPVDGM